MSFLSLNPAGYVGTLNQIERIIMKEELFEALVFQWPYLFEKSDMQFMSIGNGWYGIMETLCSSICHPVEAAKNKVKYDQEQFSLDPSEVNSMRLHESEEQLKMAMSELPIFKQVKEKFGSLRIYGDNINPRNSAYMSFAENMANRTCENCGSPGKISTEHSRMACYCESCARLSKALSYNGLGATEMPFIETRKVAPNFYET